jgi:hypothetical protein
MSFLKIKNWIKHQIGRLHTFILKVDFGGIGKAAIIYTPFHSNNARNVYVGDKCIIIGGGWIDTVAEYGGIKYNPRVEIGEGTYTHST